MRNRDDDLCRNNSLGQQVRDEGQYQEIVKVRRKVPAVRQTLKFMKMFQHVDLRRHEDDADVCFVYMCFAIVTSRRHRRRRRVVGCRRGDWTEVSLLAERVILPPENSRFASSTESAC